MKVMRAERLFWFLVKFDEFMRKAFIAAPFVLYVVSTAAVGLRLINPVIGVAVMVFGFYGLCAAWKWYEGYAEKLEKPQLSKQPAAITQPKE